eukprot:gene1247-1380_t
MAIWSGISLGTYGASIKRKVQQIRVFRRAGFDNDECLLDSEDDGVFRSGKNSRGMWNNGLHQLWGHISDMYYKDLENGLNLLPKLKIDHIQLDSFFRMRMNLAAQVFIQTMANIINTFGPTDAVENATFCKMLDQFFDCVNVRSLHECYKMINHIFFLTRAKTMKDWFSSKEPVSHFYHI